MGIRDPEEIHLEALQDIIQVLQGRFSTINVLLLEHGLMQSQPTFKILFDSRSDFLTLMFY